MRRRRGSLPGGWTRQAGNVARPVPPGVIDVFPDREGVVGRQEAGAPHQRHGLAATVVAWDCI